MKMFLNERGVVHIAAIILIALVGFMFLPGLLKNNAGIDISGTSLSDEQKQTELIRQTAYISYDDLCPSIRFVSRSAAAVV